MIKNFHTLKYAAIALMAMMALTFAFSSCQKSGPSAQKESEADPFEGETIEDIRGHQLLVYTDGLNEAENEQKQLLGNARLLELMADTQDMSSHEVIEKLKSAVEAHRAGAEPNDDLTLMCITLK